MAGIFSSNSHIQEAVLFHFIASVNIPEINQKGTILIARPDPSKYNRVHVLFGWGNADQGIKWTFSSTNFTIPRQSAEERFMMPDTLHLIIWLVAGIAGGNAAGDLLKGDYDLGLGNTGYGAIGGIVGGLILQTLIPALRGVDYGPIIGQLVIAAACGAVLTVTAGAVTRWRRS